MSKIKVSITLTQETLATLDRLGTLLVRGVELNRGEVIDAVVAQYCEGEKVKPALLSAIVSSNVHHAANLSLIDPPPPSLAMRRA